MHDISDNAFLVRYNYGIRDLTLNSFLFGIQTEERKKDGKNFDASVRNLLSSLGFSINMLGYMLLGELVASYLFEQAYDEDAAIARIASLYGFSEGTVIVNITDCIAANREFLTNSSYLLGYTILSADCTCLRDAVEIIGALFKIYYNITVDERDMYGKDALTMDIKRLIEYGKQSNK